MDFKESLCIPEEIALEMNRYLDAEPMEYPDIINKKGRAIFDEAVKFPDGNFMVIQVIPPSDEESTAWAQAILYNKEGAELTFSEPGYAIDGEWELKYDDNLYTVEVIITDKINEWIVVVSNSESDTGCIYSFTGEEKDVRDFLLSLAHQDKYDDKEHFVFGTQTAEDVEIMYDGTLYVFNDFLDCHIDYYARRYSDIPKRQMRANRAMENNSYQTRWEELKTALFKKGYDAISDFLGYDYDKEESKDITENRLDQVYANIQDGRFNIYYRYYVLNKI